MPRRSELLDLVEQSRPTPDFHVTIDDVEVALDEIESMTYAIYRGRALRDPQRIAKAIAMIVAYVDGE